jgi:hypothetical protein
MKNIKTIRARGYIFFIFSILILGAFTGCKKAEKKPDLGSEVNYEKIEKYPKWVIQPTYENGIAGVGSSKISELGFDFARKEAMASARSDLAGQIGVKVDKLFKSYTSKSGVGESTSVDSLSENVAKELIDMNLKGATLRDTWISPENELFVLMTIDNEKLKESTSTAINNPKNYSDQNLEVKMKSQNAQKELEKELNTYFGSTNDKDYPAPDTTIKTEDQPVEDKSDVKEN